MSKQRESYKTIKKLAQRICKEEGGKSQIKFMDCVQSLQIFGEILCFMDLLEITRLIEAMLIEGTIKNEKKNKRKK